MFEQLFSKSGVSLERLRTFCEVIAAGGISRAAKGDPNRQSQFSRQIKELEEYFGTKLVWRRGKMTTAGEQLHRACYQLLQSLNTVSGELAGDEPEISIGAGEAVLHWVLFPRVRSLEIAPPQPRWIFRNLRTSDINNQLLEGDLDLGILRKDACSSKLKTWELGKMTFSLFIPKQLTKKPFPLATIKGDGQFNTTFQAVAHEMGRELQVRFTCDSFPAVHELVRHRLAAGVLPSIIRSELPSDQFQVIQPRQFARLSRIYVVAANPKTLAIRPVVGKVSTVISNACSGKW